jgi:hypothetical protein
VKSSLACLQTSDVPIVANDQVIVAEVLTSATSILTSENPFYSLILLIN